MNTWSQIVLFKTLAVRDEKYKWINLKFAVDTGTFLIINYAKQKSILKISVEWFPENFETVLYDELLSIKQALWSDRRWNHMKNGLIGSKSTLLYCMCLINIIVTSFQNIILKSILNYNGYV